MKVPRPFPTTFSGAVRSMRISCWVIWREYRDEARQERIYSRRLQEWQRRFGPPPAPFSLAHHVALPLAIVLAVLALAVEVADAWPLLLNSDAAVLVAEALGRAR